MTEHNPALEPEFEEPTPVEYRVPRRCPHEVLGHKPGERFKAVLPPDHEARLIARGQLQRVVYERPHERNNQEAN